jgi:hypothetical protein
MPHQVLSCEQNKAIWLANLFIKLRQQKRTNMTSQQQNMYITESNNEWRGHHNSIIEWLGTCQKLPGGGGGCRKGEGLIFSALQKGGSLKTEPLKREGHKI